MTASKAIHARAPNDAHIGTMRRDDSKFLKVRRSMGRFRLCVIRSKDRRSNRPASSVE
jgi:hypothetical protein